MPRKLFIILILGCTIASCEKSEKAKTKLGESPEPAVPLATADTVISRWEALDSIETEKLLLVKRLLDEVSYMKRYDRAAHAKATALLDSVKTLKLTPGQASDTAKVDEYDTMLSRLVSTAQELVANSADSKNYPLCEDLLSDIIELDNKTLTARVAYDRALNTYLKEARSDNTGDETARISTYTGFMNN